MAGQTLQVIYSNLESAISSNRTVQAEFTSELRKLDGAINGLGAEFRGKAGRSFIRWWDDTGREHSSAIIAKLERMDAKLDQIKDAVRETDQEIAALYRQR